RFGSRRTSGAVLLLIVLGMAGTQGAEPRADEVTERLRKLGARVTYDEKDKDRPVIEVHFSGREVTDKTLKDLPDLPTLNALFLARTVVTGEGLAELTRYPALRKLYVSGGLGKDTDRGAGDSAMKVLPKLQRLEEVTVFDDAVTDLGLKELAKLPRLK